MRITAKTTGVCLLFLAAVAAAGICWAVRIGPDTLGLFFVIAAISLILLCMVWRRWSRCGRTLKILGVCAVGAPLLFSVAVFTGRDVYENRMTGLEYDSRNAISEHRTATLQRQLRNDARFTSITVCFPHQGCYPHLEVSGTLQSPADRDALLRAVRDANHWPYICWSVTCPSSPYDGIDGYGGDANHYDPGRRHNLDSP